MQINNYLVQHGFRTITKCGRNTYLDKIFPLRRHHSQMIFYITTMQTISSSRTFYNSLYSMYIVKLKFSSIGLFNIVASGYRILVLSRPMKGLDSWLFFSKLPDSVGSGRLLLKKPSFHKAIMRRIRTIKPTITDTMITHKGTSEGSLIFKSG